MNYFYPLLLLLQAPGVDKLTNELENRRQLRSWPADFIAEVRQELQEFVDLSPFGYYWPQIFANFKAEKQIVSNVTKYKITTESQTWNRQKWVKYWDCLSFFAIVYHVWFHEIIVSCKLCAFEARTQYCIIARKFVVAENIRPPKRPTKRRTNYESCGWRQKWTEQILTLTVTVANPKRKCT